MTEQPVETEQQFLGNEPHRNDPVIQTAVEPPFLTEVGEKYAAMVQPREHYAPNAHRGRFSPLRDKAKKDIQDAIKEQAVLRELAAADVPVQPSTDLHVEAEVHAGHAVRSLENGELDAGIAWLQSALAFAQNARHSREFGVLGAAAL